MNTLVILAGFAIALVLTSVISWRCGVEFGEDRGHMTGWDEALHWKDTQRSDPAPDH